jgi:hypothetical protein
VSTALDLAESAMSSLDAEDARISAARAEVTRLKALLESARAEERAATGWQQSSRRREARRGLSAILPLLRAGQPGVVVRYGRGDPWPLVGVVVKLTAARVTVMTQLGEMEFDRKAAGHRSAGEGRGETASGYRIDVDADGNPVPA